MNRWGIAGLWLAALLLVAPVVPAQSPGGPGGPRLVLKGYDPVAYFTDGKPALGAPQHEVEFDGRRYRFVSAEHMAMFNAEPDRYIPQFGGSCAGMMSKRVKIEADPKNWQIVGGKLYVFLAPVDKERTRAEFDRLVAAAQANWRELKDAPYQ